MINSFNVSGVRVRACVYDSYGLTRWPFVVHIMQCRDKRRYFTDNSNERRKIIKIWASIQFCCCVWCIEFNLLFYCRRSPTQSKCMFFILCCDRSNRSFKSLKYSSIDFGFEIECLNLGPHGIINKITIKLPDAFSIKIKNDLMKTFGIANWKWSFSLNVKQMAVVESGIDGKQKKMQ